MESKIEPKPPLKIDFKELWSYRELFYAFVWRDMKVRYKQTFLGVVWVLFQPLATMIIFTILFGKVAKLPSDGIPYPMFVYIGLCFWTFFSNSLSFSSQSLISSDSLIKKVYFPREILPLSSVLTSLVDFIVMFLFLILLSAYYGHYPNIYVFLTIPAIITVALFSSGLGLFLSALNIKYRDVRYVIPFFIQLGIFVTPVIYPMRILEDARRWALMLNPLSSAITGVRMGFGSSSGVDLFQMLVALLVAGGIFIFGLAYFRRTESFFADLS